MSSKCLTLRVARVAWEASTMHAALLVNDGHLMMSDDISGEMGGESETPEALGGSPVTFHLHMDDADAAWAREPR